MYKYLSKTAFYNNITINYDKKLLKIEYLNNNLNKIGTYTIKIKYTEYLDNILNLFYNIQFKKQLKKLNYNISIKVIKNF